jgi:four helix bundle protein
MAPNVRELRVWQEAVSTAGEIARAVRKSARSDTKPLTDLLVRCSSEVALAIAAGYVRDETSAQADAFRQARESATRLETAIAIARHAELLRPAECAELGVRAGNVTRLINGYVTYLERQLQLERSAS